MTLKPSTVLHYISFIKIHHTVFSLPFALIGFFLGIKTNNENLSLRTLLLVILCVLFARNAAMGFNRFTDKEIDRKNPRTAFREMPKEIIKPRSAMVFVILNCLLFIAAAGFLNSLCLWLSPVALFIILGYSYTKRFTSFSHLFLGAGLALAPIGAYLAVTGEFNILPLLFSLCVLFWVAGFDIIYSLQDIEFDKSENLKSIPARIGIKPAMLLSSLFHMAAVLLIITAGLFYPFQWIYWAGSAVFTLLIIYQHVIIKPGDLSRINMAFFTLNGFASIIFAAFVITDLYVAV